jgi:hypothetical protein
VRSRDIGDEARVFIAAILFRALSAILAFLANTTFPPFQDQRFTVFRGMRHAFWDAFARYDAGWYHGIASQGYIYGEGGRNNLAFFPLYPMLMRGGGTLLGGRQESYYVAGVFVSWIAFGFAMLLLFRLARLDLDRSASFRAVAYAAIFPFAYFFGMVYSESVFLLGLVGAVYALRTRHWTSAAVAGAAMTATRVTGVMAMPGLAWIAWQSAGANRRSRLAAVLACAGMLLGIGAYSAFSYSLSGKPFAWYDAITFWGYHPGGNPIAMPLRLFWSLLTRPYEYLAVDQMAPYDTLNVLAATGTLAMVPLIWKRFGLGYALIVVSALLLPLSSGQFEGLGRYSSVQFPLALALASMSGQVRHQVILTLFAMFYAICLALFVTVHPLF